jgi:hypothetical protein
MKKSNALNSNYLDITNIKRKFYFGKSYFNYPFEGVLLPKISLHKEYSEGTELTKPAEDFDILSLHYKGLLKIVEGDEIKEGGTLAVSGSIRKKYFASPVTGTIEKINEETKTIDIKYKIVKDREDVFKSAVMPFKGKISHKFDHHIIIEFEALTINLFGLKGSDASGNLQFIDSEEVLKDETSLDNLDLKNKIVFIETLTTELAARLSAMGVKGILVHSLSYNIFSSIMTLAMPIGIIAGYDNLELDKHLKSTLSKLEDSKIIIDTLYQKAHILTEKAPSWLTDTD